LLEEYKPTGRHVSKHAIGMRQFTAVITLFALVLLSSAFNGFAERRVAFVVGNGDYQHTSALPNPTNDSHDVAAALRRLNFDVTLKNNITNVDFREALATFSEAADGADIAIFFYAGHGLEIARQNYLVPVDAKLSTDRRIRFEAVSLDDVSSSMEGVKGLRLVLLDACRNNPFLKSMKRTLSTRSIGRGLAAPEPQVGSLVSFAAKEGTVASDGAGRNSPYTRGLLANLETPGLEVNFMFRKIRDSVIEATGGKQEPFTYGSLPGTSIYLKPPVQTAALQSTVQPQAQLIVPPPASDQIEVSYWVSIVNLNSKDLFQSYINRYPGGQFVEIARYRVAQIDGVKRTLESKIPPKVAAPVEQQVASLPDPVTQPIETAAPIRPTRAMIRDIQKNLNRVGCSIGRADGLWGKASIRGVRSYAKHKKIRLASVNPSQRLLDRLNSTNVRVCPLICKRGWEIRKGRCERIVRKAKVNPKPVVRKSRKKTVSSTRKRKRRVEQHVIVEERPRRRGRVVEEVIIREPTRRRRRRSGPTIVIDPGIIGAVLNRF